MTKTSLMLLTATLACGAAITITQTTSAAPITDRERNAIAEAVTKPKVFKHPEFVHMSFEGTMDQVGDYYAKLKQEFERQDVGGIETTDRPFLVLHGNPDKTKTLKMDIGFSIRGADSVKEPLKSSKLNYGKVARFAHRGPYKELSEVNQEFLKKAGPNADESVIILHLVSGSARGEDAETELIVPLK
jgi:effector-binding domain-containing protein